MANFAFTDADIYYGDTDIGGYSNAVELAVEREALDNTCFGATYRSKVGGMFDGTVTLAGFLDTAADPNDHLHGLIGTEGVMTIAPVADTVGNTAYSLNLTEFSLTRGASVGELHGFNVTAQVSDGVGVVRGQMLIAKTPLTTTANGTAVQVGAISSTQTGYGALHVFSGTSGTLDVKIQSDTSGFPSATDRITFTQATGATSQWSTVAGAVTDDYWRVSYTISAGTWNFAVFFGIK